MNWNEIDSDIELILTPGRTEICCSAKLTITCDGVPVQHYGPGTHTFETRNHVTVKLATNGKTWIKDRAITQTMASTSTEVFTTLDRPAPLSPEMAAIQRMQRKNELVRERDREEMEMRYAELQRRNERATAEAISRANKAAQTDGDGADIRPSSNPAQKSQRPDESSEVPTTGTKQGGENGKVVATRSSPSKHTNSNQPEGNPPS
ncbi:hypothetical protein [Microviridae sp.]|nr:hypothetical protein [Microviridae sp.]